MHTNEMVETGLEVERLRAWYGQSVALQDLDLSVPVGSLTGIVGYNGVGKSTLLRSIARLHSGCSGISRFNDLDLMHMSAAQVARSGVALVREGAKVFSTLTVEEHIQLGARLARGRPNHADAPLDVFEMFPMLQKHRRSRAGLLSGGQRQTLALAMAFTGMPSLLLLDEPSTGLSQSIAAQVYATIRGFGEQGITILMAEQNAFWLEKTCDSLFLMQPKGLTRIH